MLSMIERDQNTVHYSLLYMALQTVQSARADPCLLLKTPIIGTLAFKLD